MHPRPPQQHNVFFRLLIPLSALFVITILALVACVFSTSPSRIHRFLAEQGGLLITIEVTAILLVAAIAMIVDRIQILRRLKDAPQPPVLQPPVLQPPGPELGRGADLRVETEHTAGQTRQAQLVYPDEPVCPNGTGNSPEAIPPTDSAELSEEPSENR